MRTLATMVLLAAAVPTACSFADQTSSDLDSRKQTRDTDGGVAPDASDTIPADSGTPPPSLVDRGLVVRYFLDEAATGRDVAIALDATADPVNLQLSYGGLGRGIQYLEKNGNRGILYQEPRQPGAAGVDNHKLATSLARAQAVTLEIVLERIGFPTNNDSYLLDLSSATARNLVSLRFVGTNALALGWNRNSPTSWQNIGLGAGRAVVHVVVSSSVTGPGAAALYLDGAFVAEGRLTQGLAPLDLELDTPLAIVVGDRINGAAPMNGIIYYAALYRLELGPNEIANNATLLGASDDRPTP